jgi:predicted P-loop ATPase
MAATVTPIRRPPPPPRGANWTDRVLTKQNRQGIDEVIACKANAVTILRNDPEWLDVLAFNELSQAITCRAAPPWHVDDAPADPDPSRPWSDSDGCRVQNWLQRSKWQLGVSEQTAYKAAMMVAEAHPYDPLRDWLLSLEWDGVPRLETWLTAYLGVEDNAYARFIGPAFLIGSVARGLWPGCKMDTMLILEGPQGLFKSQAVERLYGSAFFRETPIDLRSNDRFMALRDCWCREWPELDGYGKADAARVKSFLSPRFDDFRAPYARTMVHVPRRVVFVATVNPPQLGYLVDESGNRRMWPVECGKVGPIDLDGIARDRLQLWAEARDKFQGYTDAAGAIHEPAKWWPVTKEERAICNGEQDRRMVAEVWTGKVSGWLDDGPRRIAGAEVTIRQVLTECLMVPTERQDRSNATRAGSCLARCGWVVGRREGDGNRERYYVKRSETVPVDPVEAEERAAIQAGAEAAE